MTRRHLVRRVVALGALVVALVMLFAAPASAHAELLSTDPSNGGVYDSAPKAITLRFSEGVEVALGGIRVYTGDRERVVTGKPEHPNGQQSVVTTSLPKLDNGTYVVTWRVTSADSHPIDGAYTFQVGRQGHPERQERQGCGGVVAGDDRRQSHGRRRVRHRPRRALRGHRPPHRRRGVPRGGLGPGA